MTRFTANIACVGRPLPAAGSVAPPVRAVRTPRAVATTMMLPAHAESVLAIYQAGIDSGNATLDAVAPQWETFDTTHLPEYRFVAVAGPTVLGWIAANRPFDFWADDPTLPIYHAVYVHPVATGCGIGRQLLEVLLAAAQAHGVHAVRSAIFPENTASLALHTRAGFRVVGAQQRYAHREHRWRHVLLVEHDPRAAERSALL
ncbi:GNAT family N-acetyltransferase [Aldersonia sp. NBC_00410]|uniref:GNAT family N-acetyltransferase n=1 Tax=Aldersonia sp. NBC_00410 TaxID=2975954 RepID=UPI00224F0DDC|nr:GNAT family N-acetyltransferase [Aldersonia sp. NBC_00410]MCX5044105.1 GNAT family N-acetyltransferase [Aldersonia sp. NBC_00410]